MLPIGSGKGIFRLTSKIPYTSDGRDTWLHVSTACGKAAEFTVPYPLVEIETCYRKRISWCLRLSRWLWNGSVTRPISLTLY